MSISFILEDGTGLVNSTTYVSTDFANTYHTNFGNSNWTNATGAVQQEALIQATQSVDLLYGPDYYSIPMTHGTYIQALLFPRFTFVINGIQIIQTGTLPVQLKNAVSEIALMYVNGTDIFPQPNSTPFVKQQMVKVGSLETDTVYRSQIMAEKYTGFWKVERLLKPILRASTGPNFLSL